MKKEKERESWGDLSSSDRINDCYTLHKKPTIHQVTIMLANSHL